MAKAHDLVVIGAGPAGYVGAIRAAQLGLDVAIVEKESMAGGTCLRVGCIPSKVLLESTELWDRVQHGLADHGISVEGASFDLQAMLGRQRRIVETLGQGVAGLLKKNRVTRYHGTARFVTPRKISIDSDTDGDSDSDSDGDSDSEIQEVEAKSFLIATGSSPTTLPGVTLDHDRIGDSTDALRYSEVPEHLVVIGAGVIGLELGSVWKRLGSRVTVLEYLDRILPGIDAEVADEATKLFEKQGIEFRLGSKVTGVEVSRDSATVSVDNADAISADRILVAVGRRPNTAGLGLDTVGVEIDSNGRIVVDGSSFETNVDGVFAVGDVIAGPMLAHKAEEEAIACVERLATGYGHVNYDAIPNVVYTHPEIASVGRTEEELSAAGRPFRKGSFPFFANGRARALGEVDGFVKVLSDRKTDRILGVHIIGARAGDLIAQATTAIEFSASAEDLARTCHAHPTLAETLKEAAMDVAGRRIHL